MVAVLHNAAGQQQQVANVSVCLYMAASLLCDFSAGHQHLMPMCSLRQPWTMHCQHHPNQTHHLIVRMTCLPYIRTIIGRSSIGMRSLTQQTKTRFRAYCCHCSRQTLMHSLLTSHTSFEDVSHGQGFTPLCKSLGKHGHRLLLQRACIAALFNRPVGLQL